MLTREDIDGLLSRAGNVLTSDGEKIGSIGQVYVDDDSDQPTWVTVRTGLFGTSESFVPLEAARLEGDDILVPYTKDQVKDAPRIDDDGHLNPTDEDRLYDHYGLARTYSDAAMGAAAGINRTEADFDRTRGVDDMTSDRSATVGRDTSGPTTDDAMTRSEEHLHVGKERQERGRARLRKYVTPENVTDDVTVDEDVRREHIDTDGIDETRR